MEIRRIAVWNTAFLGDALLTLPLVQVLHAAYPKAELDFYVRAGLESLFTSQPEISRVLPVRKRGLGLGALLRQAKEIRKASYDLWVDAHLSLRSSFMAWRSRAAIRAGYTEAACSSLVFTASVSRCFEQFQEIERLLRLAPLAGVEEEILQNQELLWPHLHLSSESKAAAEAFFRDFSPVPVLGVHPGSVWPTKRWTPEGFAAVIRHALEEGAHVLLFSGKGEEEQTEAVKSLLPLNHPLFHDFSGKTTLAVLAAVIARLDAYLSNDSGPMHLAWALGVPVTALFGPTVRELGFFPRGENSTVMEIPLPCRPCGLHGHTQCPKGHFLCMKNIDPEAVWADVRSKLFRNQ